MNVEEASKYLKIIADPNRLTIIKLLTKKLHMYGNELLKEVNCKQSTLSHHLSELTNSGLLNSKKSGNKVIYSLNLVKYSQLLNSLGRIDRSNTQLVKEDKPYRVVDSKLINKDTRDEKEELPTFLL